jgi:glycosyltransferase involved in cell wall biosynthesis
VDKPRVRQVWQWVERRCLPRVDAAFTVSQSVADEYRRRYGVEMTVVRNLPERIENGEWRIENYPGAAALNVTGDTPAQFSILNSQLILYQGAVNVGRGVREMVDVMGRLPQCRLVVAGDGDLLDELRDYAAKQPWADRISFLGRVRPDSLHQLTRQADLGVCLLEDLGMSYRCALPNRVGDFAQAGVPLVATGFAEIRRVLEEYAIGTPTEPCPAIKEGVEYGQYLDRLADTITNTLHLWQTMPRQERERRFERARKDLCWENEKKTLLVKIDAIINKK